jgi:hypothetical protein
VTTRLPQRVALTLLLLGDKERAKAVFARAYELKPDDLQIQKEYEASGGEKKNGR